MKKAFVIEYKNEKNKKASAMILADNKNEAVSIFENDYTFLEIIKIRLVN